MTHFEIVVGYMNVFCKTKDYANALALVDWALAFYPGLKDRKTGIYGQKRSISLGTASGCSAVAV